MTKPRTDLLFDFTERRTYHAGESIFLQGDAPSYAYVVHTGTVVIRAAAEEGRYRVLNRLGPGQIFGELAFINGEPRTATAVAAEPTELLLIGGADFVAKFQALEPFMKSWIRILIGRIVDMSSRIV
jgi:CRP-like cAMP-binding protein